jgi:hypothetical protein
MEAIRFSETSVHTRSTCRHNPEDGILHSHRRENLKYYMFKIPSKIDMNMYGYFPAFKIYGSE